MPPPETVRIPYHDQKLWITPELWGHSFAATCSRKESLAGVVFLPASWSISQLLRTLELCSAPCSRPILLFALRFSPYTTNVPVFPSSGGGSLDCLDRFPILNLPFQSLSLRVVLHSRLA